MKEKSVTYWNSKTHGVVISKEQREEYKISKGLDSEFYAENQKTIMQQLKKRKTNADKIDYLKDYLSQMLEQKLQFKQIPPERDFNGFNVYEIATNLLIDNVKEQISTYNEINKAKAIESKLVVQKLNWLGTPSQFGYIFSELAKKGFIELPQTNGEGSYSKYAKVSFELFAFEKTTIGNLEKEMNFKKNTLSEAVKSKFSIPNRNEISSKKKK